MNSIPKPLFLTVALLAAVLVTRAAVVVEQYDFTVGSTAGDIPDDGSAIPFSQTISTSQILDLTEVRVNLNLSGNPVGEGWAGDMFVSLNFNLGSRTAILLNQVGIDEGNAAGHSFDGWNITFRDGAANGDVHLGQPTGLDTILTGTWQPDGRLAPADSDRPSLLQVFNHAAGNGGWHLTVADLGNPGGMMTLNGWSIIMTGNTTAVPEPGEYAALAGAVLLVGAVGRRLHQSSRR